MHMYNMYLNSMLIDVCIVEWYGIYVDKYQNQHISASLSKSKLLILEASKYQWNRRLGPLEVEYDPLKVEVPVFHVHTVDMIVL